MYQYKLLAFSKAYDFEPEYKIYRHENDREQRLFFDIEISEENQNPLEILTISTSTLSPPNEAITRQFIKRFFQEELPEKQSKLGRLATNLFISLCKYGQQKAQLNVLSELNQTIQNIKEPSDLVITLRNSLRIIYTFAPFIFKTAYSKSSGINDISERISRGRSLQESDQNKHSSFYSFIERFLKINASVNIHLELVSLCKNKKQETKQRLTEVIDELQQLVPSNEIERRLSDALKIGATDRLSEMLIDTPDKTIRQTLISFAESQGFHNLADNIFFIYEATQHQKSQSPTLLNKHLQEYYQKSDSNFKTLKRLVLGIIQDSATTGEAFEHINTLPPFEDPYEEHFRVLVIDSISYIFYVEEPENTFGKAKHAPLIRSRILTNVFKFIDEQSPKYTDTLVHKDDIALEGSAFANKINDIIDRDSFFKNYHYQDIRRMSKALVWQTIKKFRAFQIDKNIVSDLINQNPMYQDLIQANLVTHSQYFRDLFSFFSLRHVPLETTMSKIVNGHTNVTSTDLFLAFRIYSTMEFLKDNLTSTCLYDPDFYTVVHPRSKPLQKGSPLFLASKIFNAYFLESMKTISESGYILAGLCFNKVEKLNDPQFKTLCANVFNHGNTLDSQHPTYREHVILHCIDQPIISQFDVNSAYNTSTQQLLVIFGQLITDPESEMIHERALSLFRDLDVTQLKNQLHLFAKLLILDHPLIMYPEFASLMTKFKTSFSDLPQTPSIFLDLSKDLTLKLGYVYYDLLHIRDMTTLDRHSQELLTMKKELIETEEDHLLLLLKRLLEGGLVDTTTSLYSGLFSQSILKDDRFLDYHQMIEKHHNDLVEHQPDSSPSQIPFSLKSLSHSFNLASSIPRQCERDSLKGKLTLLTQSMTDTLAPRPIDIFLLHRVVESLLRQLSLHTTNEQTSEHLFSHNLSSYPVAERFSDYKHIFMELSPFYSIFYHNQNPTLTNGNHAFLRSWDANELIDETMDFIALALDRVTKLTPSTAGHSHSPMDSSQQGLATQATFTLDCIDRDVLTHKTSSLRQKLPPYNGSKFVFDQFEETIRNLLDIEETQKYYMLYQHTLLVLRSSVLIQHVLLFQIENPSVNHIRSHDHTFLMNESSLSPEKKQVLQTSGPNNLLSDWYHAADYPTGNRPISLLKSQTLKLAHVNLRKKNQKLGVRLSQKVLFMASQILDTLHTLLD